MVINHWLSRVLQRVDQHEPRRTSSWNGSTLTTVKPSSEPAIRHSAQPWDTEHHHEHETHPLSDSRPRRSSWRRRPSGRLVLEIVMGGAHKIDVNTQTDRQTKENRDYIGLTKNITTRGSPASVSHLQQQDTHIRGYGLGTWNARSGLASNPMLLVR